MNQIIRQYRFYGDKNRQNQPNNINITNLKSGSIFFDDEQLVSIVQLGVQTIPGTLMYINNALEPVIIGSTGIYELDLKNTSEIIALRFDEHSLDNINKLNSGYLIVDAIYNTEEGEE